MKPKTFQISYCIGAYNEEKIALSSCKKIASKLTKIVGKNNYEIIIVNNGSTDNTYKILKSIPLKNLRIYSIPEKGHGLALKTAVQKAKYEYCIVTAIDIPFGFDDLKQYLKLYDKYDIVFGSKAHPESHYDSKIERKLASFIYRYFLLLFFGLKIKDPQGSILFNRKKVLPFLEMCSAKNAFFTTQIAIHANRRNLSMIEIPITSVKQKRKSKYSVVRDGRQMLKSMIKEYFYYKKLKNADKKE